MTTDRKAFEQDYDRAMFRSSMFSAIWALIADRKKKTGYRLGELAETLGRDKGYVSRLFSRQENCKLNTISDIARALDAEIRIEIVDRRTGVRFGPTGMVRLARETQQVLRQEIDSGVDEASSTMTRRWTVRRNVA